MPRKRRRRHPGSAPQQRGVPAALGWRWRTFPVFFAFVAGLLVASVLAPLFPVNAVVFYGALFGVAFGLAHIFTRWLRVRRERRGRDE